MPRSCTSPGAESDAYSSAMPRFSSTVMERKGLGIWNDRAMPSRSEISSAASGRSER